MRGPECDWLGDIAAEVADGGVVDWDALASRARTNEERSAIRRLRAIAAIGRAHADLPLTDSTSESLSVRSLLRGPEDTSTPTRWGHLQILERVGRGRFGDVYRAWDPHLDRDVALKLLRQRDPDASGSDEIIEEGRLMARVSHPNVITIHGAQRIEGRTGIWMQFVEGRTLEAELTDRGPFAPEEVARVGIELCRALVAVHEAGLVHRDVKAHNVLRGRGGRIVLGDFGAGHTLDKGHAATLAGTPAYLAPEIFQGSPATASGDIYSLGVLLYHLATGGYPVSGHSLHEICKAHIGGQRTALLTCRPDFPAPLAAIVERACAPDATDRCDSAAAMELRLKRCLASTERATGSGSNQRRFTAAVILLLAGVASIAVLRDPSLVWRRNVVSATRSVPRSVVGSPVDSTPEPQRSVSSSPMGEESPSASNPAEADEHSSNGVGPPDSDVRDVPASPRAFRQLVGLPASGALGTISSDGRFVSVTHNDGSLAVVDRLSGRRRTIPGTETQGSPTIAGMASFSRDGSRITYLRMRSPINQIAPVHPEIRSIPANGGESRLIWRAPESRLGVRLHHWAGDDDVILAGRVSAAGHELMLVDAASGRVYASHVVPLTLGSATLSPDGRFVAFDIVDPDSGLRDIDLWSVNSNTVTPLIRDSSSDRSPMWTPDGQHLLFLSSRSGSIALWAQRVDGGRPIGVPVQLDPHVGPAALKGVTASGTLLLERIGGGSHVYVADTDPATLALTSEPRRVASRSLGRTGSPTWSPDGSQIAFFQVEDERRAIVIKSLADGQEREFRVTGASAIGFLRWEPDGKSLVFTGMIDKLGGLQRLALATGEVKRILGPPLLFHNLLPQPEDIVLSRQMGSGFEIARVDLRSGTQTILVRSNHMPTGLMTTHSGDRVAFGERTETGRSIRVADVAAQEPVREVYFSPAGTPVVTPLAWSPDDRELLVARWVPQGDAASLWALDVAAGSLRPISSLSEFIASAEYSRDGRHIAMEAGSQASEPWVLENALAALRQR